MFIFSSLVYGEFLQIGHLSLSTIQGNFLLQLLWLFPAFFLCGFNLNFKFNFQINNLFFSNSHSNF